MYTVSCRQPILIINSNLREFCLRADKICFDGKITTITSEQRFDLLQNILSVGHILKLPFVHSLSDSFRQKHNAKEVAECEQRLKDFVTNCFVYNSVTGESLNIYQWVPCGHCDVCQSLKVSSIVQRASFALEEAGLPAAYVTLTYSSKYNPKDNLPLKVHAQLFKKRFTKNLLSFCKRRGLVHQRKPSIKYILVSERGKKGRPHYHMLIYGIPRLSTFDPEHDYYVNLLLRFSWRENIKLSSGRYYSFSQFVHDYPKVSCVPKDYDPFSMGFVSYKEVNDAKVTSYITKYCYKTILSDDDLQKNNFRLFSKNLGVAWLKAHIDGFNVNDGTFSYCSTFDLQVKKLHLSGFYLKKLFPSISKIIPVELRKNYLDAMYYSRMVMSSPLDRSVKRAVGISTLYLTNRFPYLRLFETELFENYKFQIKSIDSVLYNAEMQTFKEYVVFFARSFQECLKYDYLTFSHICEQVLKHDTVFSNFKPWTFSEICDIGNRFRRTTADNISRKKL